MSDRLKNEGEFPELKKIRDDVQALVKHNDVDDMLALMTVFIWDIGNLLSRRMELEGEDKKHFLSRHMGSPSSLANVVKSKYEGVLTQNTVRTHFLAEVIPNLISHALLPFHDYSVDREKYDKERHAVAPVVAGLYDAARGALASIKDAPELSRRASSELLVAQARVGHATHNHPRKMN